MVPYGLKVTRSRKKGQTNFPKKNLKDLTKSNRKMGGRSLNITSGAFGDTLLRRLQALTLPDATPPICIIYLFSKMAVTFEPVLQF